MSISCRQILWIEIALALALTDCSSTALRSPGANRGASLTPSSAAKMQSTKPLDARCAQHAECGIGLICANRPKGQWEEEPPGGPVCRGRSCGLGDQATCPKGSVCCPLLTGIYGPYCLLHCRGRESHYCPRLLDHADAECNTVSGCCHIPKIDKQMRGCLTPRYYGNHDILVIGSHQPPGSWLAPSASPSDR